MHPIRKRKLRVILLVMAVLAIASALILYALRQNISLFYSPTQLVNESISTQRLVRIGGMVVPGSIVRSTNDLTVRFKVTDYQHTVEVSYRGVLPDLFREGQGIVAQGHVLDPNHFNAIEVLAKHDEKYMPPEVKSALSQSSKTTQGAAS